MEFTQAFPLGRYEYNVYFREEDDRNDFMDAYWNFLDDTAHVTRTFAAIGCKVGHETVMTDRYTCLELGYERSPISRKELTTNKVKGSPVEVIGGYDDYGNPIYKKDANGNTLMESPVKEYELTQEDLVGIRFLEDWYLDPQTGAFERVVLATLPIFYRHPMGFYLPRILVVH